MKRTRAILPLLAVILVPFFGLFAYGEVLPINTFGGLDTENDPLFVDQGRTPDAENIVTDIAHGLSPRAGFVIFSTEASNGQWTFNLSNGSSYRITESSGVLKASLNSSNYTITLSTVNTAVRTAAAQLGDKFYWASADGLKHWNTSVVTVDSPTLNFTTLAAFKGRLAGAGVVGDERRIYLSEYLNGSNFQLAVDPVDTDPTRIPIQVNNNENILVLFSSFMDKLIWATANSFGGVSGSRRSTFLVQVFSDNIGSAYPESFQDCDGRLRFLGSKRTIWEFNGATTIPISTKDIKTLLSGISQGDANARSFTQTTQADWSQGTSFLTVALDTAIAPGDVTFKAQSTVTVPTDDFQDSNYTSSPTWTVYSGSAIVVSSYLTTPTDPGVCGSGGMICPDALLATDSTLSTGTWEIQAPSVDSDHGLWNGFQTGRWYYSFMANDVTGINGYAVRFTADNFISVVRKAVATDTDEAVLFSSACTGGCSNIRVSRTASGVFTTSFTCNGTEQYAVGVDTSYATSQYFVIKWSNPSDGIPTAHPPRLARVIASTPTSLYIYQSTYTSQTYNMGTGASSWGVFYADSVLDPGTSISYTIYSDSDSSLNINNPTTFISSQAITSGQVPTIQMSSYVTVSAYFDRSTHTAQAALNDFTVSWVDGSRLLVPSLYYLGRYHIGVALNSSANNVVLVYGRDNMWQRWRGINMNSGIIYNSYPYFGNATGVYQMDSGNTDNGSAITAYYRTKRFLPAGPNFISAFDDFYITAKNSADTLNVKYYVDGVDSSYTLANYVMNSQSGQQDVRLPFTTTMLQQGRMIEFLFTVSGMTDWRLVNANLYFTPETVPLGN